MSVVRVAELSLLFAAVRGYGACVARCQCIDLDKKEDHLIDKVGTKVQQDRRHELAKRASCSI
jgi:hypothetical protein